MTEVDQRITLAREYLAGARQRDPNHLPPSRLMSELAETRRQLGQVLAAVADAEQAATGYRLTPEQMGTALAAADAAAIYRSGDAAGDAFRELARDISGQLRRGIGGQQ